MENYILIRSDRKTLTMKIDDDLNVVVRAPKRTAKKYIDSYVENNSRWIAKAREQKRQWIEAHPQPGEEEIKRLKQSALEYFTRTTEYYSGITGLYPTEIKITYGKSRLGSCGYSGRICYSWRAMLYPEAAREYLVVHELCHLVHMNHSREYYSLVEKYMPDWKARRDLFRQ